MKFFILLTLVGCSSTKQIQSLEPDVVFIRAALNVGSGLDEMAKTLEKKGFSAKVYSPYDYHLIKRNPRVIVGYSLGSDRAIYLAKKQRDYGCPADIIILIDPWLIKDIPDKIGKVYVIIGRGNTNEYKNANVIRIREEIPVIDYIFSNINHLYMDKNKLVQKYIYDIIKTDLRI